MQGLDVEFSSLASSTNRIVGRDAAGDALGVAVTGFLSHQVRAFAGSRSSTAGSRMIAGPIDIRCR